RPEAAPRAGPSRSARCSWPPREHGRPDVNAGAALEVGQDRHCEAAEERSLGAPVTEHVGRDVVDLALAPELSDPGAVDLGLRVLDSEPLAPPLERVDAPRRAPERQHVRDITVLAQVEAVGGRIDGRAQTKLRG